ncbi:Breast cancer 2, early onset [Actinomortierella wolfii]|nr:Breast cancer 2, early onset [Actinomortierella wolfii]
MVESRRTSKNFFDEYHHDIHTHLFFDKGKNKVSPLRRAHTVADISTQGLVTTPPRPVSSRIIRTSSDLGMGRPSISSALEENISNTSDSPNSAKMSLFDILTGKSSRDLQSPSTKSEGEGIMWSSSLETPPRQKQSSSSNSGELGIAGSTAIKTPVKKMLARLGEDMNSATVHLEDEAEVDSIEWSSTLETPPKKTSSPNKRASDTQDTPSSRKARVIDRLRGMPSESPSTQERQRWIELQSGATPVQPSANSISGADNTSMTPLLGQPTIREWSPIIDASDDDQSTIVDIDMGMQGIDGGSSAPELSLPQPPSESIDGLLLPSSLVEDMSRSLPVAISPQSNLSSLPAHGATFDHFPEDTSRKSVITSPERRNSAAFKQDSHTTNRLISATGSSIVSESVSGKTSNSTKQTFEATENQLQHGMDTHSNIEHVQTYPQDASKQDALIDPNSEDDFGNIRISQIDDGLTMLSDSTQGHSSQTSHQQNGILSPRQTNLSASRRQSTGKMLPLSSEKSGQSADNDEDSIWLSKNAHLLGGIDHFDESAEHTNGDPSGISGYSTAFTAVGSHAPATLGGFSTGKGKPLKPVSKEALHKWSSFFDDDQDSVAPRPPSPPYNMTKASTKAPHVMSGFTTGRGQKPIAISEEKMQKWANFFEDDHDTSNSGIDSHLPDSRPPTAPMKDFSGFSSGSGKKLLQPISKEAQERARKLLDMDDDIAPATLGQPSTSGLSEVGFGRPSLNANGMKQGLSLKALVQNPPRPASGIASLRRTMGASARLGSASGSRTVPMKAKLPFKPPSMATHVPPSLSSSPSSSSFSKPTLNPQSKPSMAMVEMSSTGISGESSSVHRQALPPQQQHRRSLNTHRVLHPNAKAPTHATSYFSKPSTDNLQQERKITLPTAFDMTIKEPRKPLSALYRKPLALEREELLELGIHKDIVDMTLDSAKTFRFAGDWGVTEALSDMAQRDGVLKQHISQAWVANHYALIVWKLACYVRSWPVEFEDWFCPNKVVEQLLYRYEREVNRAERPALRKIVEGDESSQRHIVLCIADVKWEDVQPHQQGDGVQTTATNSTHSVASAGPLRAVRIKVTDGWYVLPATVDTVLYKALERGKLRIGSKIGVCRAKQGGMVPGIDVVVLRKYPMLFLENLPDGTWVKRTRHEEDQAAERHQEELQRRLQDYAQQLTKDPQGEKCDPEALEEQLAQKAQELRTDRQVKPVFMLRVASFPTGNGERDTRQALLTFWNDSHATYEEGRRYRFTSVVAKRGSSNLGGHSLAENVVYLTADRTTTSFEMTADAEKIALSGYEPRRISLIESIGHEYTHGDELDLAVIVLAHGPPTPLSGKPFVIVTDMSRQLLLVECPPATNGKLPNWMKPNAKILLTSAKYKLWDSMLNIPVVQYTNGYTQVTFGGVWTAPVFHPQPQQQSLLLSRSSHSGHKVPRSRVSSGLSGHQSSTAGRAIVGGTRMSWPTFAQQAWENLDILFDDYKSAPQPQYQHQHQPSDHRDVLTSLPGLSLRANELLVKLNPAL